MLALIAGEGRLPVLLAERLDASGEAFILCEMDGFPTEATGGAQKLTFSLATLGTLLERLRPLGVTRVCLAGAVRRPSFDPVSADAATRALLPAIAAALSGGDDAAIRALTGVLARAGFTVVPAHEILPSLMPPAGVLTAAVPRPENTEDVTRAVAEIDALGAADRGQACVVANGAVLASEGVEGTAAMLTGLARRRGYARGGILFKAPKPGQSMLADVPAIGPETAHLAAAAGLDGIVIAAGGVLVLDLAATVDACDRAGMFLWVREAG